MERPIRPKYTSTVILCGDNLVNNSQNNKTPKWFIGRKRQNKRQQALLVETLLADLNVARGNASEKTTLNLWTALTKRLNTMGCSRTVEEWQNVWKKWHEKVSGKYRRICLQERHPLARGGPATKEKLNEIEMKILDIVGRPSIDELRTTVIEQGRTFVKDQGRTAVEEQADVEDPLDAPPAAVCRVCLTGDRKTYRVNMALERTYDAITGFKLQRAGRPTALCCVCVSQLRRCRRFIDTARESNAALDRWYQNRAYADFKLKERPLFSFTKTTTAKLGVTFRLSPIVWEPKVKQEKKETVIEIERQNDQGTFMMDEIKHEIIDNDELNTLDDDQKYTQMSDDYNKNDKASDDGIDRLNDEKETHLSDNDDEIDYTDRRIVETDDSDDFEWAMDSDKNKVWDYVQLYVPKAGDEGVGTVASTSRGDNFQSVTDIVAQDSTTVAQDPAIVSQDFGIVAQDPAIAAQDPAIVAQDSAVVTQNPAIVAQDSNIVARNSAIIAQDSAIVAQDSAIVSRSPELAKRIKLEEDATNGPGIKQRKPSTLRQLLSNTYTASSHQIQRILYSCSECTYRTTHKSAILRHLTKHTG